MSDICIHGSDMKEATSDFAMGFVLLDGPG